MCFRLESHGTNNYLVYRILDTDEMDSMSLGMLTNNKIPGLASTLFTQKDTTKFVKFNVERRRPAREFFNRPINKKSLLGIFNGIVDAMLSADEYMIDPKSIVLDLNYIFVDVSTCETVLICMPIKGYNDENDIGDFFKKIMFCTQFDQTENCDYVAKMMNYLNSAPVFSLEDFKKVLEEVVMVNVSVVNKNENSVIKESGSNNQPKVENSINVSKTSDIKNNNDMLKQNTVNNVSNNPGIVQQNNISNSDDTKDSRDKKKGLFGGLFKKDESKNIEKSNNVAPTICAVPGVESSGMAIPGQPSNTFVNNNSVENSKSEKNKKDESLNVSNMVQPNVVQANIGPQSSTANFGETTVLNQSNNIGETTVLNVAQQPTVQNSPYLIRTKNNEKIPINKPVFRVGKEKSYVDYFIGDNTAISRSHANIITRDGEYFVLDTNSTNHTYVNGEMIQSNVEVSIDHGTKIMFGNEDFEFKLY